MKNEKHKAGEETDKQTERKWGRMEPEGREKAKTTTPTSAPAPSQPALFSAQEMALQPGGEVVWAGGSKQLYPLWANWAWGTGWEER